jgi:peptidyl-tRNA hydrolase, PTH1 family
VNLRFSRATPLRAAKLVVGLGNPGAEYSGTRHNVGFRVVEGLAAAHRIALRTRRYQAVFGVGEIGGETVCLAKPMTYMNLSGQAVAALLRVLGLTPRELIVVCDDVNLPVGRLRIRLQGSAGGSGGLKSIATCLSTEEYPRLRLGVGRPGSGDLIDHVLGSFGRAEIAVVGRAIETAVEAVEVALRDGVEAAMNRYNTMDLSQDPI